MINRSEDYMLVQFVNNCIQKIFLTAKFNLGCPQNFFFI